MFFLRPSGIQFVDRGELSDFDYTLSDFTRDEAYHDLDLSGIVGSGKRLVMIQVELAAAEILQTLFLVTKGHTGLVNRDGIRTQVAATGIERPMLIMTDNNGVIRYMFSTATWLSCTFSIRCWLKL